MCYVPRKGQRLSDPRSISRQSGNPVDKYGDEWEWDPVKGEWGVQTGKEHTNVGPDGESLTVRTTRDISRSLQPMMGLAQQSRSPSEQAQWERERLCGGLES